MKSKNWDNNIFLIKNAILNMLYNLTTVKPFVESTIEMEKKNLVEYIISLKNFFD